VASILAFITLAGLMSPVLLLILTFALAAGDAFESPTWRAVLPELVEREDLTAASAVNGIEFNFARAIGPALAGFVIAAMGVGTAFVVNAVSFFGVILVIARWRRVVVARATPPETVSGATLAAIRYVRYSPSIRAVIPRAGAVMFFASGLMALLPSIARRLSGSPLGYGILLGSFGMGALQKLPSASARCCRFGGALGRVQRHRTCGDHCFPGSPEYTSTSGAAIRASWRARGVTWVRAQLAGVMGTSLNPLARALVFRLANSHSLRRCSYFAAPRSTQASPRVSKR
jgi:MFS family permease